jgi:hypothetical protein
MPLGGRAKVGRASVPACAALAGRPASLGCPARGPDGGKERGKSKEHPRNILGATRALQYCPDVALFLLWGHPPSSRDPPLPKPNTPYPLGLGHLRRQVLPLRLGTGWGRGAHFGPFAFLGGPCKVPPQGGADSFWGGVCGS